jgi:hypothetical protein
MEQTAATDSIDAFTKDVVGKAIFLVRLRSLDDADVVNDEVGSMLNQSPREEEFWECVDV